MAQGDVKMRSKHAAADLTVYRLKAFIKIQQFIYSLSRNTDRHHRDFKAVKLLIKEIIELNT